jgi:hypothetical protein
VRRAAAVQARGKRFQRRWREKRKGKQKGSEKRVFKTVQAAAAFGCFYVLIQDLFFLAAIGPFALKAFDRVVCR